MSAYLFQNSARQKSFDYLLLYMEFNLSLISVLNFHFLRCLGLNDVFSTSQFAEIFSCILLQKEINYGFGFETL